MSATLLAADPRLHVLALVFYGLATVAVILGSTLHRPRLTMAGWVLAAGGAATQAAGLLVRWYATGHGPYVSRYEVLSANALVAILLFFVLARIYPLARRLDVFVFPSVMILVAVGLYSGPEVRTLPPTFSGTWLVLHVCFYFVAFAAALVAAAASTAQLGGDRLAALGLPDPGELDGFAHRAAGITFVFWGIGMVTGSIWAYYAWGRFWAWDPIETWSLITWFLLGLYLHLRRFFGWKGQRAAVVFVACFLLAVGTLFFTSFITGSNHAAYFR